MHVPSGLPTLRRGNHEPGDGEACAMEYVSVIAGLEFGAQPTCTDELVGDLVIGINDTIISDDYRSEMLTPILHRLANCPPVENSRQIIGDLMRKRGVETNFPDFNSVSITTFGGVEVKYRETISPAGYIQGLIKNTHEMVTPEFMMKEGGSTFTFPVSAQGFTRVVSQDATEAVKFLVEILDALDEARGVPAPEPYSAEFLAEIHAQVLALA